MLCIFRQDLFGYRSRGAHELTEIHSALYTRAKGIRDLTGKAAIYHIDGCRLITEEGTSGTASPMAMRGDR